MESEVQQKFSTVEQLIDQKVGGVADAKKRAESLQNEAKQLLLQASDKLQLLKGDITASSSSLSSSVKDQTTEYS